MTSWRIHAHTARVQTEDPYPPVVEEPRRRDPFSRAPAGVWALGERLTWLCGLLLTISVFTDWYAGSSPMGPTIAYIGWHTGALGKLVFFVGLAVLALVALREAGIELPATVPESLVVIALGSLATIFVLIRLISIPDDFVGAGRGIGIWISLVCAVGIIVSGLLAASEEL